MAYDFTTLSPADFEDLSRELVGSEIGVRFEGFSAGPDGGIDGRFAVGPKTTILQAKHYVGSPFSSLKSAMRREAAAIASLAPSRYLLATSRPLTPGNKGELEKVIGSALKSKGDIFGPVDLNFLLRKFPSVEKAHIKLWLSSSTVLERIIRSAAYSFTATSRAEIEAKVGVYAQNPSFKEARDRLERNHVLIISGPPGVGKTTLAEMLSYAYIGEEWEFVAIRSLDDGFGSVVDAKKQIFFFDDFLGKVALDSKALAAKDSELVKFIRRIRKSSNARFILTTRAYIFEEAKRVSEYIAEKQVEITTYVLDVGIYTRRIRARILYNHLYVARLSKKIIRALLQPGVLPEIIDHRNYNPRIIEWMTDLLNISDITSEKYVQQFLESLEHPARIWDTAFRTHIPSKCQNLLLALFFCSQYGVDIEDLERAFNALHPALSKKYGQSYGPKDFGDALKIVEGSFLTISNRRISFINPSVRDYLAEYLRDVELLASFAPSSQFAIWAKAVWEQFLSTPNVDNVRKCSFALLFVPAMQVITQTPVWTRSRHDPTSLRFCDLDLAERAELFFDWWSDSFDNRFIEGIRALINTRPPGYSSFRESTLIDLIRSVKSQSEGDLAECERLYLELEGVLIKQIKKISSPDDLEEICDKIDASRDVLSGDVVNATYDAIDYQLNEMESLVSDVDSESTLNDQLEAVEKLGRRVQASSDRISRALEAIKSRIEDVQEGTIEADEPDFSGRMPREPDRFEDGQITDLFSLLL